MFLIFLLVIILFVFFLTILIKNLNTKNSNLNEENYSDQDKENTIQQKMEKYNNFLNILKNLKYKKSIKRFEIPIYYINLEKSKDRDNEMINQKNKYNLFLQRIEGVYGKNLQDTKKGEFFLTPDKKINFINKFLNVKDEESVLGCTLSHIKAIYTAFINNNEIAMIVEDDTSFITFNHWSRKIGQIIKKAPLDWEIINLFHFCEKEKNNKFKSNKDLCFSTTCYIINRKGMNKLIYSVLKDNCIILEKTKKNIEQNDKLDADFFIYNLVESYHYNGKLLIFPNILFESTIHPDHFEVQLNNTLSKITNFLKI